MKSVLMALISVGVIGVGAICELCPRSASTAPPPAAIASIAAVAVVDSQTVRLRIGGMTCGGCAISARVVLERLEGVTKAEVNYEEKLAIVTYDRAKVTPEQMINALKEKLKYTATVVEPKRM